jgi:hypothetical protein
MLQADIQARSRYLGLRKVVGEYERERWVDRSDGGSSHEFARWDTLCRADHLQLTHANTATNSMRNTSSEGNSGGGDDRQPSKGNEPAREHYVDDKTILVGLIVMRK